MSVSTENCPVCFLNPKETKKESLSLGCCAYRFCSPCVLRWLAVCQAGERPLSCPTCKARIPESKIASWFPEFSLQEQQQQNQGGGVGGDQEEKRVETKIREETKACPGCQFRVVKIDGCNRVRCPRPECKTSFCYSCELTKCTCYRRQIALVSWFAFVLIACNGIVYSQKPLPPLAPPFSLWDHCILNWDAHCELYSSKLHRLVIESCQALPVSDLELLPEILNAETRLAVAMHNFRGKDAKSPEELGTLKTFLLTNQIFERFCPIQFSALNLYVEFWGSILKSQGDHWSELDVSHG